MTRVKPAVYEGVTLLGSDRGQAVMVAVVDAGIGHGAAMQMLMTRLFRYRPIGEMKLAAIDDSDARFCCCCCCCN